MNIRKPIMWAAASIVIASLASCTATNTTPQMSALSVETKKPSPPLPVGEDFDYDFVAGPTVSGLTGEARLYEVKRPADPIAFLDDLARALGVEGDAQVIPEADDHYRVGAVNERRYPDKPSIVLGWARAPHWSYTDATGAPVCEPSTNFRNPGPLEFLYCGTPPSHSAAPSEQEARSLALDIFESTGLDASPDDISVTSDAFQTTASAALAVNGTPTDLRWSATWGASGTLAVVSGYAIELVEQNAVATVSAREAVDRLDAFPTQWIASPWEPTTAFPWRLDDDGRTVVVQIDHVTPAYVLRYDEDDRMRLAPGFLVSNDRGGWQGVMSSQEESEGILRGFGTE